MRETTIDGHLFKIRHLTRGEIKQLRTEGFIIADLKPENAEAAQDRVFEIIFSTKDIEAIDKMHSRTVIHELWPQVLAETYGNPAEEKN